MNSNSPVVIFHNHQPASSATLCVTFIWANDRHIRSTCDGDHSAILGDHWCRAPPTTNSDVSIETVNASTGGALCHTPLCRVAACLNSYSLHHVNIKNCSLNLTGERSEAPAATQVNNAPLALHCLDKCSHPGLMHSRIAPAATFSRLDYPPMACTSNT